MLLSFSLVFIVGIILSTIVSKIKLPPLIGLILTGIILGPFVLNILSSDFLNLSVNLREIALIIIIFRAGLNLDVKKLLENKISVLLLSFLPATFEIVATMFLAKSLLNLDYLDGAILGCVISAVSPAVIVPSMIKLIDEKYGVKKGIPQMIMSAASVDDIYVITLFLTLISLKSSGGSLSISIAFNVIIKIILGVIIGLIFGSLYNKVESKIKLRKEYSLLIMISILFLINNLEVLLDNIISFSSLLSIMAFGAMIKDNQFFKDSFTSLWSVFEILLFALIGSQLDFNYLTIFGLAPFIVIMLAMLVRSTGSFLATSFDDLNIKERLFIMMSFLPKATVQAAIGPIALAMGFASGEVILTTAIISILISAPLGSFLINKYYKVLLSNDN